MKMPKLTFLCIALMLALVMIFAVGCPAAEPDEPTPDEPTPAEPDPEEPAEPDPDAPKEITVALTQDPMGLDPTTIQGWNAWTIAENIHDTFLVRHRETGDLAPGLVTSWDMSNEARQWDLELRDDVYFHDGTHLDAEAVKLHFERVVAPETRSPVAAPLLGGRLEEVEILGDYSLRFHFNESFLAFGDALASGPLSPVSPTAVQEKGEDITNEPVGTGPFMFEEWVDGSHISIVRNPDYAWAPDGKYLESGPAKLEKITFQLVLEGPVAAEMVMSGDVDGVYMTPDAMVPAVESHSDVSAWEIARPGTSSMWHFNTQHEPTDDVRVRQALFHAIDPEEVNLIVYDGVRQLATGVIGPLTPGFREDFHYRDVYPIDLGKAAELLDEAGWELDESDNRRYKDGDSLELVHICFPGHGSEAAEVVQSQLERVGIFQEVRAMDNPGNVEATQAGEHHIRSIGWGGTDISGLLHMLYHPDEAGVGWNFNFNQDEVLINLIEEAERSIDADEQVDLVQQAEDRIFEMAFTLPFNNYVHFFSHNNRLAGLIQTAGDRYPLFKDVVWTQ